MSTAGRTAVVLAAVALALLGLGTPAARAHDELVATTPAADSTVVTAPASVQLQLSAPPQALGTQVVVTAPGGAIVSQGQAQVRGSTVVQPLAGGLAGGVHTVAWRVTSSDGHPLSGAFTFTVAGSPAVAEAPASPPAELEVAARGEAAAAQPVDASSRNGWIAAGAVAVVALAAAVLLPLRRRG